ncbi:ClpP family protease [Butyrivibrio sp. WCD2001]|uniref:ClpP family protease n=1 Tax=Butyrivibrio sp. WCD2001 TaxID=1280681 RepID=UPI000409638E|nr:ATP-dependent Clp protease proteolytic subunit [Butyrivibrio sp. WCD2001]
MAKILFESTRGFDQIAIEDIFLKNRKIFLTEEVNAATMDDIIKQVMYLEEDDPSGEITFFINSPGGSVSSGLALYDMLMHVRCPIRTVCIGLAASMGAILFLAGDKREIMAHGQIMVHDPSFGRMDVGGLKPHEIQQQVDSLNETKEAIAKIIAERTGKSIKAVYKVTANDTFFNAEKALEYGLATSIIRD